ncbi:MAG: ThuA domain-containing protein [Verrucomicrobia bacterium]|nr:ThuA domain-containing protein [Verrucomicrobiota bacterium]
MFSVLLLLFSALCLRAADPHDQSGVPLEVDSPNAKLAKIVILVGGPSSKAMAHEYFAGGALLMNWLKEQPGVWPVMARDWPKNEAVLKGAKCVVYYGDGGGKQPFLEPARWKTFSKMLDGGCGFVLLHQAVDFPTGPDAEKIKGWLGGVFHGDIGSRGHWDMDLKTTAAAHPALHGVQSFAAPGDGWLFNLHFAEGRGFTPLLVGQVPDKGRSSTDAKAHAGRDEIIAWAYERPKGGRGFGFTGADLHKSWSYEGQRKLVVNAILWSAGLEVPKDGAKTTFDEADLNRNLDVKATVAEKKAAKKTK